MALLRHVQLFAPRLDAPKDRITTWVASSCSEIIGHSLYSPIPQTRERLIRRKDTPQPASTPPGIYGIIPLSPNTETLEDLPRSVVHPPLSGESVPSFNTSLEVDELRSLSMYHRNPENVQDVPPFIFLDQPISSYTFLPPAPQLNDHHSLPRGRAAINPPSIHTQTHNVPSPRQSFTGENYISSQHQQDFYLTGPSLDLTQRYRAPEFDYRWYPQPSTESERDFVNDGKDGYP